MYEVFLEGGMDTVSVIGSVPWMVRLNGYERWLLDNIRPYGCKKLMACGWHGSAGPVHADAPDVCCVIPGLLALQPREAFPWL